MRKRSRSRELALQILYQVDLVGRDVLPGIETMLGRERRDAEIVEYALRLVHGTLERGEEIDRRIVETADWRQIETGLQQRVRALNLFTQPA